MNRTIVVIFAALACAAPSCGQKPPPPPVEPDPPGVSCETDLETLRKLGGCGVDLEHYLGHCQDREKSEAELGARNNHACTTAAKSCQEYASCK